ncbi:MAG TPA: hypothetical protein VHX16_03385, partial [Chloroflexota bacterium]|nr:hypothetical protein [Chloroflexota bacterium]
MRTRGGATARAPSDLVVFDSTPLLTHGATGERRRADSSTFVRVQVEARSRYAISQKRWCSLGRGPTEKLSASGGIFGPEDGFYEDQQFGSRKPNACAGPQPHDGTYGWTTA